MSSGRIPRCGPLHTRGRAPPPPRERHRLLPLLPSPAERHRAAWPCSPPVPFALGGGPRLPRDADGGREDAYLRLPSACTQNGSLVCLTGWRSFCARKSLCTTHFGFGSRYACSVGVSLRATTMRKTKITVLSPSAWTSGEAHGRHDTVR
jgi:hypothetical protein